MVDVLGNALLLETWAGHRWADPLMQGLHALFGAGAVASPAALGSLGYKPTFLLFACISATPLVSWSFGQALWGKRPPGSPLTVAARAETEGEEELSLSRGREGQAEGEDVGKGVAEAAGEEEEEEPPPVPRAARLLICSFFFLYVGLGASYLCF
jgi:hypothetical protein